MWALDSNYPVFTHIHTQVWPTKWGRGGGIYVKPCAIIHCSSRKFYL